MYIEDVSQLFGCFRCGAIMGEIEKEDDVAAYKCCECGEHSIVGFVQAMDMLNELHIKGELTLIVEDDTLDFGELDE